MAQWPERLLGKEISNDAPAHTTLLPILALYGVLLSVQVVSCALQCLILMPLEAEIQDFRQRVPAVPALALAVSMARYHFTWYKEDSGICLCIWVLASRTEDTVTYFTDMFDTRSSTSARQ